MTLGDDYAKTLFVPKVFFVNEHREVDVEAGQLISDVANELGIAVKRTAGVGFFPDYTVFVKGAEGSTSPMTWYERVIKRCKGWRRMADETLILGDIEVWTTQGIGYRLKRPRPMNPAARASEDGSARFDHENNEAGTAWNPYGHPKMVASGTREPPKYVPKRKKKAAAKEAAPEPEPVVTEPVAEPEPPTAAELEAAYAARGSELLKKAAVAEMADHADDGDSAKDERFAVTVTAAAIVLGTIAIIAAYMVWG